MSERFRVGQSIKTIDLRDNSDFYVDGVVQIEAAWVQNRQAQSEGVIVKRLSKNNSLYVVVHPGEIEAIYYETELETCSLIPDTIICMTQKQAYILKDAMLAQWNKVIEAHKAYEQEVKALEGIHTDLITCASFLQTHSSDTLRENETWKEELGISDSIKKWIDAHREELSK